MTARVVELLARRRASANRTRVRSSPAPSRANHFRRRPRLTMPPARARLLEGAPIADELRGAVAEDVARFRARAAARPDCAS